MNKSIEYLKKFVPQSVKLKVKDVRLRRRANKFYDTIRTYQNKRFSDLTEEEMELASFIKNNPIAMLPYEYTKRYDAEEVVVYFDNVCNMKYVLHDNKRLYFPEKESCYSHVFDDNTIRKYYSTLLKEQDVNSPHRYESAGVHVQAGDVVADIGAAEGIFALSVIDKVKKVYLFEVLEEWVAALKMTFGPWKEKVVIVNKYVSNISENDFTTLDDFLGHNEINFIKADIEGSELDLLQGARNILATRRNLRVALCTYHHVDHAESARSILASNEFLTEFSNGYIVSVWEFDGSHFDIVLQKCNYITEFDKGNVIPLWDYAPFFRKGVIRGRKV